MERTQNNHWHLSAKTLPQILPAGSAHLAHHAERLYRYQQLVELRQEGLTTKEIARRLDMAERTVRSWLKRGIPFRILLCLLEWERPEKQLTSA